PDQGVQDAAIVLARQPLLDELDAEFLSFLAPAVVCRDDSDALRRDTDVPQHERERALPDAAEADEHDASRTLDVYLVLPAHDAPKPRQWPRAPPLRPDSQRTQKIWVFRPRISQARAVTDPAKKSGLSYASEAGRFVRSRAALRRVSPSARAPDSSLPTAGS